MNSELFQFHERQDVVSAAQSRTGKLVLWAAATALLLWHGVNVFMLLSFALVCLYPERRRWLLMLVSFGLVVGRFLPKQGLGVVDLPAALASVSPQGWLQFIVSSIAATVAVVAIVAIATRFERLPPFVRRHPVLVLHVLLLSALVVGVVTHLKALLFAPYFMWRASYLLKSAARGGAINTSLRDHLFYLVPVFGGSNTPFGKGLDYLGRFEAKDAASIARSQLAGVRLLGLAIILTLVLAVIEALIIGRQDTMLGATLAPWALSQSTVADLLRAGESAGLADRWFSIYLDLVLATIELAIWGHVVVGCLRLLGFNVFRNSYKPLLARSIVEFWNRFYFYFKELLVEFFFYPAFYRSGFAAPALRLFLAIFAAAFVGNLYYHVVREFKLMATGDWQAITTYLYPRMVYCLLLALGIWLSMLRQQKRRRNPGPASSWTSIRAMAGVWTFYGLIHVWLAAPFEFNVAQRWRFLLSLGNL